MKKVVFFIVIGFVALSVLGLGWVRAEAKEYAVPSVCDFSGPFADIMPSIADGRDAVIRWWNDIEGKKLGVKLVHKKYDMRYDPTVVASLWPGILSGLKPIALLGLGGADVAALQERLPKDKVPAFYGPPTYGYCWLPNQWIFSVRATYIHEYMACLVWYINQHPEKRPVKVATMGNQASPAPLDIVNGVKHYVEKVLEPRGMAKMVATEWIDMRPVDVSSQMKNIIDAKADFIFGLVTSTMSAAAIRAQQLHGVNIPTIASPWHTIWSVGRAMKTYEPWEGHYVPSGHIPITEKDSKAYSFYKFLQEKYGIKADWNPMNLLGVHQTMVMVRCVERAAKRMGGENVTGQAVYDAIFAKPFTEKELMELLPTLHFTKDAPFPSIEPKIKIETVRDGKYVLATPEWVPVPTDVEKW